MMDFGVILLVLAMVITENITRLTHFWSANASESVMFAVSAYITVSSQFEYKDVVLRV